MELNYKFEISADAWDLLNELAKGNILEYRDIEYSTLEDFLKSDLFISGAKDVSWYLNRNSGGTFLIAEELYSKSLIQDVEMAWHTSYEISEFGKEIIKQNS